MKKQYLTVLLAFVCLFGLGAGAQAQEEGRVVEKIPYEFVAGGKTLPAGTYAITRISSDRERPWEIRNTVTPRDSAILQPIFSDGMVHPAGLSLERVSDTYYLSRVATAARRVYPAHSQGSEHRSRSKTARCRVCCGGKLTYGCMSQKQCPSDRSRHSGVGATVPETVQTVLSVSVGRDASTNSPYFKAVRPRCSRSVNGQELLRPEFGFPLALFRYFPF
jgi:hypothetical protein